MSVSIQTDRDEPVVANSVCFEQFRTDSSIINLRHTLSVPYSVIATGSEGARKWYGYRKVIQ